MSHSVKLKQLNVSHNRVGDEGAIAIAEALSHNASLQLLDLSMNNIGLNGATALTKAYRQSETLQQLNIGTRIDQALQLDLNIADATITAVQNWQFVTTTAQILTNELLDLITNTVAILSANELKISTLWFTPESAGALSTLLKENQTLTQLRLTSCKPARNSLHLAEHKCKLRSNQCVSKVRLKGRNIVGEKILVQLLDGVNHSKTLKTLDMSGTKFSSGSPQAAPLIHRPVFLSTQLTPFEIEIFSIGDAGAQLLADGLKCNTTLEELNISRNDIGDTGALAMADLLTHNSTLRHLDLSFNSVEDRGATAIAVSLGRNKALQELDLSESLVQDSGASSMAEMLKMNTTLRQLHMYTSKLSFCIGLGGTKALVDSLEVNQHLLRLTLPDKFHEYLQTLPTYREHKQRIEHNYKTKETLVQSI